MDFKSELSKLYPQPKTLEQRMAERDKINAVKRRRNTVSKRRAVGVFMLAAITTAIAASSMSYVASTAHPLATTLLAIPAGVVLVVMTIWSVLSLLQAYHN